MSGLDDIRQRLTELEELTKEYDRIIASKDREIEKLIGLLEGAKETMEQLIGERDALVAIVEADREGYTKPEDLHRFVDGWKKMDPDGYRAFVAKLVAKTDPPAGTDDEDN